ncbi:hypothetical protein HYH02_005993 [Chlamydomonas schloesseri]|uniref:J domain-containing protein n=1 Tax=Chlamydomonas schloesseri TaxID=2026947 RepID=A0A835WKH2_9CHLO|nr:hypothetical protein HYH02_005993 [Chlamydomonas schloesseri]|eukprot:KAG2449247.1 hypothetical protein HYH02_005993 [Chlamydomonas schloesseri]
MDGTTYLRQFGGGALGGGGAVPASGAGASVRSGLSPMDITPQGSVGSAASAASNVFVLSPLAGGFGASAGAQQGGASVNGGGPTAMPTSPMPFQGFAAAAGAPPSPAPMFTTGAAPAPTAGPAARPQPAAPAAAATAFAAGTAASGATSSNSRAATGGAAKPPIQIHMPGAREVADMFSAAAAASTASTAAAFNSASNSATSSGGAAQPRPVAAAAPAANAAGTAAAVFGGALKKTAVEAASASSGANGIAAGASSRLGAGSNDLQPAKDSGPKLSREPSSSGTSGANGGSGGSLTNSSNRPASGASAAWAHMPVPAAAAPQPAPAEAGPSSSAAPAPALAPASGPSVVSGASASDELSLRVYQECYAEMRRRALTSGAAAADAEATARSVAARAVDVMSAAPTTRMLVEKLIDSGSCADIMIKAALDMPEPAKAAGVAAPAAASPPAQAAPVAASVPQAALPSQAEGAGPGRTEAAVESMLKELKLEDQRAAGAAAAGAAGTAAARAAAPAAGSGSPLSVPFVFAAPPDGGATSSTSSSAAAPAPAPAPAPVSAAGKPTAAPAPAPAPAPAAAAAAAATAPAVPGPQPAVHTHVPFVFGSTGGGAAAPAAPAFTFGGSPPPGAAKPATSTSSTGGIPFTFGGRSPAATAEQARPSTSSASTSNVFAAAAATAAAVFANAGTARPASAAAATGGASSRGSGTAGQAPPVSSSSGWTNVPRGATANAGTGDYLKFNVGTAAAGGVGAGPFAVAGDGTVTTGVSGTTPGRAGAKGRAKVTPRKGRMPSAAATSAGGAASAATAGGAAQSGSAALGGGSAFNAASSAAAAPATSSATSAPAGRAAANSISTAEQPQRSGASSSQQQQQQQAGDNMPSVQAVRLKRSADEKKQQGNAKYEQNDFRTAERWYSEAIDLLEQQLPALGLSEQQTASLFPNLRTEIAVLYSNRSGARLMTSKPHSALADALRAMALDGKFLRAASRAATCHCRLGNFSAAHRVVETAMERVSLGSPHYTDICKKLHEVVDLGSKARAATAAAAAAAGTGSRDKLQEAADALAAIRDQVAYCDVVAAARAVLALRLGAAAEALALVAPHPEVPLAERAAPWRLWLVAQARFFKGDLQEALTTCRELQLQLEAKGGAGEADAAAPSGAAAAAYTTSAHVVVPPPAALAELAEAIQQLIKLKEDGNAAFKASKHAEASDHYTKALASGACPPAFAAVLHANRAAAAQGLGQLADAVADCGRARALDPSYYKASARLAGLMLELRRPENAQGLLEPLTKLTSDGKDKEAAGPSASELEAIKGRLTEAKAAVSWQKTPHHYKLLGLASTCSEEEVRKAYRRLALKHHPDKAMSAVKVALTAPGAAGAMPCSGPLAVASELEARVREEAAWLFNFINQAHEELSDKARRRKIDQLLEAEQPPAARYGGGGYSSNPYANAFGGGSRYGTYGAYGGFYDQSSYYRAAPTGAGAQRARTGTGSFGTGSFGGAYGGARPSGSRPAGGGSAGGAAGAARGGGGGSRPTYTAGSGGGNYGGYTGRGAAGAGAGTAGQRKWWEGTDSDDDDQDAYHF